MKVIATQFIGFDNPNGIESSPGLRLVEIELDASDRDQACVACAVRGLCYVGPLIPERNPPEAQP